MLWPLLIFPSSFHTTLFLSPSLFMPQKPQAYSYLVAFAFVISFNVPFLTEVVAFIFLYAMVKGRRNIFVGHARECSKELWTQSQAFSL